MFGFGKADQDLVEFGCDNSEQDFGWVRLWQFLETLCQCRSTGILYEVIPIEIGKTFNKLRDF